MTQATDPARAAAREIINLTFELTAGADLNWISDIINIHFAPTLSRLQEAERLLVSISRTASAKSRHTIISKIEAFLKQEPTVATLNDRTLVLESHITDLRRQQLSDHDTIADLRRQLAEVTTERDTWKQRAEGAEKERDMCKLKYDVHSLAATYASRDADTLRTWQQSAMEVLRPFAEYAAKVDKFGDAETRALFRFGGVEVTVGNLRAARKLWEEGTVNLNRREKPIMESARTPAENCENAAKENDQGVESSDSDTTIATLQTRLAEVERERDKFYRWIDKIIDAPSYESQSCEDKVTLVAVPTEQLDAMIQYVSLRDAAKEQGCSPSSP
jgi:hypothetical protein